MRRSGTFTGTQAEVLAELDEYGLDRLTQGKEEKARDFARAIAAIEAGADEVEVGHMVYRVVEGL